MSDHKVFNTPLIKKIGIKENDSVLIINNPIWINPLLAEINLTPDNVYANAKKYKVIWIFENTLQGLESHLRKSSKSIVPNGMIWISWYKKASKFHSDLNEDTIREAALAIDLIDVKVASVDENWSALKLVIPLKNRNI